MLPLSGDVCERQFPELGQGSRQSRDIFERHRQESLDLPLDLRDVQRQQKIPHSECEQNIEIDHSICRGSFAAIFKESFVFEAARGLLQI